MQEKAPSGRITRYFNSKKRLSADKHRFPQINKHVGIGHAMAHASIQLSGTVARPTLTHLEICAHLRNLRIKSTT
jgi:hypothetical protein